MARPTDYTDEIGISICSSIAIGMPLTRICKDVDGMPDVSTVYRWLLKQDQFREIYTRAREDQADTMADEIIEIADDGGNDTYTDKDGNQQTNHDVINRSRLRVDARKWVAAKLKPKKYGDKIQQEHSGELTMPTLNVILSPPPPPQMADGS